MAFTLATTLAAAVLAAAQAPAGAPPAFSRAEYFELVRSYARGDRARAVAGLGAWSERDLARQLASVEQAARAAERCPSCPNSLSGLPLRAAVMLLWDRDRTEQPSPEGVEQLRRCPGALASLAGRLARVLARSLPTADFARRFFRMVVSTCQWDACFDAAERWASEAIALFPRDADLLLARGSVREESATLGTSSPRAPERPGSKAEANAQAAAFRRDGLAKARRDFEDALAVDEGASLARVRLGRVQWRLGEPEPARQHLERALESLSRVDDAYLAHLFLGRIHQDAGRLDEAREAYARAAAIHPSALSAGIALSNALWLSGDAEAARLALRRGLRTAGRRTERDPHWDYLVGNALDLELQLEALHRDSLE